MPCRTDPEPLPDRGVILKINELQHKLDLATRVACTAMTAIEDWGYRDNVDILKESHSVTDADVRFAEAWFAHHKEEDKIRKEKLIQSAIEKLTLEEVEALGLKKP